MVTSQARCKWTNDKHINLIKCLQDLGSSCVKFSFLNICFNFDFEHLCFDLFLARFWFSLLTFIKFSIYSRLLYFNPGLKSPYNQPLYYTAIKDIRNRFRLEKDTKAIKDRTLRDINDLFEHEEK